jgi:hypothetical protein
VPASRWSTCDEAGLHDAGIRRGHGIWPEAADDADELLAEGQVVGQRAIGAMQEGDALVADSRGCGPLLGLAQEAELERVRPGVVATGIAARAADQVRHRSVADPAANAAADGVLGSSGCAVMTREVAWDAASTRRQRSSSHLRGAPEAQERAPEKYLIPLEAGRMLTQ